MSRTHLVTIERRHTGGTPLTGPQAVCTWAGEVCLLHDLACLQG